MVSSTAVRQSVHAVHDLRPGPAVPRITVDDGVSVTVPAPPALLSAPIVHAAVSVGGAPACGDAGIAGPKGGRHLNAPIIGIASWAARGRPRGIIPRHYPGWRSKDPASSNSMGEASLAKTITPWLVGRVERTVISTGPSSIR